MNDSNSQIVLAPETIEITSNYVEVLMDFIEAIEELKQEKSRLQGRFVTAVQGAALNCSASGISAGHTVKMFAKTSRVARRVVESLERKEQR
jgi:hypothetical protein